MKLEDTDLIVDRIYREPQNRNASDNPRPKLLDVDNRYGFRRLENRRNFSTLNLLVLESNLNDPDWSDHIDTYYDIFTYYDNKSINEIHDTTRKGNLILRNLFNARHPSQPFDHFPVMLLFNKDGDNRDICFLALAVPVAQDLRVVEHLVAIWCSNDPKNKRHKNYELVFTIPGVPIVSIYWLKDIRNRKTVSSPHLSRPWLEWTLSRKYTLLYTPHRIEIRKKEPRLLERPENSRLLKIILKKYQKPQYYFEHKTTNIVRIILSRDGHFQINQLYKYSSHNAKSKYIIGSGTSSIDIKFALEERFFRKESGVFIKKLSWLKSRPKRQPFGAPETTSNLTIQAYKEPIGDSHPVTLIPDGDIISTFRKRLGNG
ncbi:hypothetical protein [Marinobacter gelidimuriae]|uniref:hypothetical protein n=1 Tax=Marinobacter gelidimuriae TaxID=2739064 RepID=UPI000374232B|nr:hypothetical protein [Marinobacter gelidimuriae]